MKNQTDRDGVTMHARLDLQLLAPALTEAETIAGCLDAQGSFLAGVVVKPCFIRSVTTNVPRSDLNIRTVVGYSQGGVSTEVKLYEAKRALTAGARTLEMTLNAGYARAAQEALFVNDIRTVCGVAHMNNARLLVGGAVSWLAPEEWLRALLWLNQVNVDGFFFRYDEEDQPAAQALLSSLLDAGDTAWEIKAIPPDASRAAAEFWLSAGCSRVGIDKIDGFRIDDHI